MKPCLAKALLLIALAIIISGSNRALAQSSSPLSSDKVAAKEQAVADHAIKRADCKKQAKAQKLSLRESRAFVRDCMAAK